jgi:ketosteroid isomerase-like protein
MADHDYAQIFRDAIRAMNSGNLEVMGSMLADDVVWHSIGAPEPVRGKAAMAESLGGGSDDFSITAEVHAVTVGEGHVVGLVRAHATKGSETLDYDTAEIFHVRDGLVTERWAFSSDTARIIKFFS